jgi:hypothetical protein
MGRWAEGCKSGPVTNELLAKWHACPAMADKLIYFIVAAVDDIGSAPDKPSTSAPKLPSSDSAAF